MELKSVLYIYGTQKWGDKVNNKKIGRPVGEGGRKENDIKVRLNDETHKKLLDYCCKNNLTKAEAIRRGIHLLLKWIRLNYKLKKKAAIL